MKQLFLALVFCDALLVLATGAIGLLVADRAAMPFRLHFAAGLVTAMMLIFTHVVIFMYFVVTGKLVMRAAVAERVNANAVAEQKRLKARAIRFAAPAIASIIVVTSTGAIAHQSPAVSIAHLCAVLLLVALNAVALGGQYACIDRNGRLLQSTLTEYTNGGPHDRPPSEHALALPRVRRYLERRVDRSKAGRTWPAG